MLAPWKKSYDQPRQHIKKQRPYFADRGPSSQSYGFSSSHVWMWEFDHKEGWALKNWCFCTMVLEKTLESPLDCTDFQPVHSKGDQFWVFIGRTDAEAETPKLCPPHMKSWLIVIDSGIELQELFVYFWDEFFVSCFICCYFLPSQGCLLNLLIVYFVVKKLLF